MATQRNNAYTIHRPRIHEDRETVRRQQKELRRIRQRERRQKMTIEQIEKQRECARQYYLRRKNQQPMRLTEQMDVSMGELRTDPCRTVVEIKQFTANDFAYRSQQRGNLENQKFMIQTNQKSMTMDGQSTDIIVESKTNRLNRHNNRLTHVKREARSRVNRVVSGNGNVRSPRLTHIRREARGLSSVVGESNKYGIDVQKLGSFPDENGSISLIHDHAQILIEISRMNRYSSTCIANCSKESVDLNMNAVDVQLDPCEDEGESTSDSEEVLAFLSGLSAKKINLENMNKREIYSFKI